MMRTTAKFLFIVFATTFWITSCTSNSPTVYKSYVSKVTLDCNNALTCGAFAISHNGQYLASDATGWVDIDTGEKSFPLADYVGIPQNQHIDSETVGWSPDDRFFASGGASFDSEVNSLSSSTYIFDNQTHAAMKVSGKIHYWSPFNARYFLGSSDHGWGMFAVDNSAPIFLNESIDFQAEAEFGGTNELLWSKRLGRPVARLEISPILSDESHETGIGTTELGLKKQTGKFNLYIKSFSNPTEPFMQFSPPYQMTIAENPPLNNLINAIFDPTGKYILIEQWECSNTLLEGCSSDFLSFDTKNVTDTMLTLIDWKTGEKQEIYRVSQLGTDNVVGAYSLAWSADGSTIIIGRYNAQAVVLKIKYP